MMHFNQRSARGAIMIAALIMVVLLTALSTIFAYSVMNVENKMEVDLASTYSMELAESALDWNVQRIYRDFNAQNNANKLSDATQSPIGNATVKPTDFLLQVIRNGAGADSAAPLRYDYVNATTGSFSTGASAIWTSTTAWKTWGPGKIKLAAKIINSSTTLRYAIVEMKAWSQVPDALRGRNIEKEVRRVVRFSVVANNKIYDFAYFANNYGWMYGGTIYIHGSMGSNGNLGFQSGPTVNGLLYAAINPAIGANGTISGTANYQNLVNYRAAPAGMTTGDPMVLPPNPSYTEDVDNNGSLTTAEDVNHNKVLDSIPYSLGYKGVQDIQTGQQPLDIPYLGDLQYYKDLANTVTRPARPDIGDPGGTGGVVKQLKAPGLDPTVASNYNIIVNQSGTDAVYGDDATENGAYATWTPSGSNLSVDMKPLTQKLDNTNQFRNGNLALMGTPQQPIVISGPVVITNDLVIRGTIKGQGTFYTGRNVHVVGDITYADGPNWRDPSNSNNSTNMNNPNFNTSVTSNLSKDLVGFAAKGSIVLGQYNRTDDSWNTCMSTYFKTGFQDSTLESYQVDPTDAAIGYANSTINGNPYFSGDYTSNETDRINGTDIAAKRYGDVAAWDSTAATVQRRYIDSSFPNDYIQRISTAGATSGFTATFKGPNDPANSATANVVNRPAVISGVYYTNHLFGGRIGSDAAGVKIYGTMVARDEGCVFNTKCQFVYDPRASDRQQSSHVNIYIPIGTIFQTMTWEELTPGQ